MSKARSIYAAVLWLGVCFLASCNHPLSVNPYTGGALPISGGDQGGNPGPASPSPSPDSTGTQTGTSNGTQLDSSGNLTLASGKATGTYTSVPTAMTGNGSWNTVGWTTDQPYNKEIPTATETGYKTFPSLTGLQALYHFDESTPGANGFADSTTTGANATCGSGCTGQRCGACPTASTGGKLGGAVNFNGTSTFLSMGTKASLGGATSFSVAGWIQVPAGYAGGGIIVQQRDTGGSGDDGSFQFFLGTNTENGFNNSPTAVAGGLGFWTEDAQQGGSGGLRMVTAGNLINDGQWHHVAAVRMVNGAAATATIYVDGKPVQAQNGNADALTSTNGMYIGWDPKQSANYFPANGMIDEVAFFSRDLAAADVTDLYQRGALRVKMQFQTCSTPAECTASGFTSVPFISELMNATSHPPTGLSLNVANPSDAYLQYQITLESDLANATPTINLGAIKPGP